MSTFDINANRIHHPANWEQKPKLDGLKALAAQIFPALNARITEWKYRRTLAALLDRVEPARDAYHADDPAPLATLRVFEAEEE